MHPFIRHQIVEGSLPAHLRVRYLVGAAISMLGLAWIACKAVSWLTNVRFDVIFGDAKIAVAAVLLAFWLLPLASCIFESVIRRRVYAGALRRASLPWMATYGIVALSVAWAAGAANIPLWHNYLAGRHLASPLPFNVPYFILAGGFLIGWLARTAIVSFSDQPPQAWEYDYVPPDRGPIEYDPIENKSNSPVPSLSKPLFARADAPLKMPNFRQS